MAQFIEQKIAEDIKVIVFKEVRGLLMQSELTVHDTARLEKLAKVYQIMMADQRENKKTNLYGKLTTEELEEMARGLGLEEDSEEAEGAADTGEDTDESDNG